MSDFIVNDTNVAPGSKATIRFKVARLPSGTRINLDVKVYRSKKDGPTGLILGGVHGDEINGVEIVRRAITSNLFEGLLCGNIIVIPILNIYGFNNFSRDVPDGKDVNRSFPGSRVGSLASRVAYMLYREILPKIDFGLDFHTGGASRYNYPQVRYSKGDKAAKALAEAFAPPVLFCNMPSARTLRKEALKIHKPILIYEGGEALRFDGYPIQEGLNGIQRVLKSKGMIANAPEPSHVTQEFSRSSWVRASRSGIFIWEISSGSFVKKGDLLGRIYEPTGHQKVKIKARRPGYIIGHNNAPLVSQGDALFHMAYIPAPPKVVDEVE